MKRTYLIVLITVLVSAATAYTVGKLSNSASTKYSSDSETTPIQRVSFDSQSYPDFTYAAENAVKAVVHVKVVKRGLENSYSLFDFFFGYGGAPNNIPREQIGAGSGVIITSDGYIITNNHVIDGADEIKVTLDNNKSYTAKLIGSDEATDIALIKVEEKNLPFLTFGNSDSLRLGEWVLAIGNPYNLRSTVTAGIVSAKARSMPSMDGEFKIEAFIQTDAAVNPGNSGGALVNTRGELVGINTAIASRTGSYTGYSFAVPTTIAKKVVEDIIDFGKVQRAIMGITMQEIDSEVAKENNLNDVKGVLIAEVRSSSAAEKAGIKAGDVLLSVNGVTVKSAPEVQEQISKYRPKDKISVQILRNSKQINLPVVLQSETSEVAVINDGQSATAIVFGAKLREAQKTILEKLGLRFGVEVMSVENGKFLTAGIKKGFIITHINQIPVKSVQEVKSVFQKSRRSVLIEGVYPDGSVVYYGMGL